MKPLHLCAAVLLPLALTACGYTPLYAPVGGAELSAGSVAANAVSVGSVRMGNPDIAAGERRVAGLVAQRLRLDFPSNGPGGGTDTLDVDITETTETLAVQRSATVARAQIALNGLLRLTGPDGTEKLRTTITTKASYNIEDSPFSTESGKTFAQRTAADNLAQEISRRVVLFYKLTPVKPGAVSPTVQ
jgi:hypothetical protein